MSSKNWKNRRKRNKQRRNVRESSTQKVKIKKPNKIILRKIQDEKNTRRILAIAIPIFILIILSPLLYRLIVLDYILPKYGKETEAVLTGRAYYKSRIFSSKRSFHGGPTHYSYTFFVNGEKYMNSSRLDWEIPPVHLGDTVKVIYLECFPSINLQVKEEESD